MRLISGTSVGTDNKREFFSLGVAERINVSGGDDNHLAVSITLTERKAEVKDGRKRDWNITILLEFIHIAMDDSLILKCLVQLANTFLFQFSPF